MNGRRAGKKDTRSREGKERVDRGEWADIGPGEEAVDLQDLAPEVQRIGLDLTKAHPIHEKMESSGVQRDEVRESVRDLSSVEILLVCLRDVPSSGKELDSEYLGRTHNKIYGQSHTGSGGVASPGGFV